MLERQIWEAAICNNTSHNQQEGLRGISKPIKGADWHFLPAARTEISFDHTLVGIQASKHCYLRGKMWFASKTEGKQVVFVLSYKYFVLSFLTKQASVNTLQSHFIIRWFAWGEHKSAWLDKEHEVE